MKKLLQLLLPLLISYCPLAAQMWNGADTLYGNEWIQYDQPYYKIPIAKDGVYQVSFTTLQSAGLPVESVPASQFQLFYMGEEIPLYTSTDELMVDGDFLEFHAAQNRGEIDQFLFAKEQDHFNPFYSLFSDTVAVFLTWQSSGTPGVRYELAENNLPDAPPAEAWFWHKERLTYSNRSHKKYFNTNEILVYYSQFDSDGYGSALKSNHDITLNTPAVVSDGPEASLFLRCMSNDNLAGHNLHINIDGAPVFDEPFFFGALIKDYEFTRPANSINSTFQVQLLSEDNVNDQFGVAYLELTYPRYFEFSNQRYFPFTIQGNGETQYLEIASFNAQGGQAYLYDLSNNIKVNAVLEGGLVKVKLPPATGERQLVLCAKGFISQVTTMQAVNFINYFEETGDFIFVSNPKLYDDGNGINWVQEYADYRASLDGGAYDPIIVEVQQLYDQFAYGIPRHPLSIRNFGYFAQRHWENTPQYMLLIGKAREYNNIRSNNQLTNANNQTFFVPTYGRPGSDNLLLASNTSSVPIFPIGRIAASEPNDIRIYLQKVKDHEAGYNLTAESERAWHKEMIHLGGGGTPNEQSVIRTALTQMEEEVERNDCGANVLSVYKTSTDPIQQSQSEVISQRITDGVSIITFFGHSSAIGFDFSLDDPNNYQNVGRYPVLFSLGCLSGQIHTSTRSVGEDFIFVDQKGALVFVATVGYGYISALSLMQRKFYEIMGSTHYGRSIGAIMNAARSSFDANIDAPTVTLNQQYTIHGDPSIIIHPFPKPDFILDAEKARFNPSSVNAKIDSMELNLTANNIGKAVSDSVLIKIERIFPDGVKVEAAKKWIPAPKYESEITFKIPILGDRSVGFNRFLATIDDAESIEEFPLPFAEQNNRLVNDLGQEGIEIYIFANGASPVYPPDFAIIGEQPVTLSAVSADVFEPESTYLFELDTTLYFDSPQKLRYELRQKGGLLQWAPNSPLQDGLTYYWRISPDSTSGVGYQWQSASFTYQAGSPDGWMQQHYFQYAQDQYINMEIPEESRRFKFLDDVKTLKVTNGVYPDVWPGIFINNDPYTYLPWDDPVRGGIYVCVLDSISIDPWINFPPGDYGSILPPWAYWAAYPYWTTDQDWRQRAIRFLQDTVPSRNYVLIYTVQHSDIHYEPEEWAADSLDLGTNLFQVLEAQGATQIRNTASNGATPYVFFYKKDDPSFTPFEQLTDLSGKIDVNFPLPGIWDNGSVRSPRIGPARSWSQLQWITEEEEGDDEFSIDLLGIRADSTQSLLVSGLSQTDTTLAWIDAAEYPWLQLYFNARDTLSRTAPQLGFWKVLYEGLPEAVLNPAAFFEFQSDTLQQGFPLEMKVAITNVSPYDMDSLAVSYKLTDAGNNTFLNERLYRPLPGKDSLIAYFNWDTKNAKGLNQLVVEANPLPGQPELSHANNIGLRRFFVKTDERNPLLDVTFDGIRILDGDLVSAKPSILIALDDENPRLPLSDTSVLRVFIQYPNTDEVVLVPYTSGLLEFIPAQESGLADKNRASVSYTPQFSESGIYTLLVQGQDASGNQVSNIDYRIRFEVITERRLSNVLNYPNPFSTATQFVYTLTGDEAPAYFKIQIMTISGRIVREITQDELGPMRVGTHRTEYVWDGTDEYGDRLANGVYLYRIVAKDSDGADYDKYDTGTDRFFKNNIGKLVILR
ncbi:MAG TPA: C25 family cysteine peptidase [Saprospiraceae bacterium]|mgnify:CR=1 FL=1|nr:C25 family cysteine peptidase [Saprospiraceae bacterium]HMQ83765.1 C25 family cysteine peptidase [Saprospiraceae bacterium]